MNEIRSILFNLAQNMPGFLLAIVVHEAAHAYVADKCGDSTAKKEGRLTLNPVAHYDPVGSIFVPIFCMIFGFMIVGWAKPVPVESRNFKNWRTGTFFVSFAGPFSNLILAAISAMIHAVIVTKVSVDWAFFDIALGMLRFSIFINFILAFFNLLPLPPLDGSKMVASFLKGQALYKYEGLAKYTPLIFIAILGLSFLNYDVIGPAMKPVVGIANWLMFSCVDLFGGLG